MIIEIKPLDTLFFRDGKPFSMGEETWADAIFPPFPSTIYGALRSAWFSENVKEFRKLSREDFNTEKDPTKKLKINNIIIKKDKSFVFSMPRDILGNKKGKLKRLTITDRTYFTSIGGVKLLINPSNQVFSYQSSWISKSKLKFYLNCKETDKNFVKNIFKFEPKIGIARDKITHSSAESQLYRVGMLRLEQDVSIYVDFEGLEINRDFFKLGAEGKFVQVSKTEQKPEVPFPEITDNKFLLYFSTPAIFKNGWLPDWINENNLQGEIPNTSIKVKLITAAIGKPKFVGGFDMANRKPKPMYKAVPEGSVYYFEVLDGNVNDLERIHGKSLSDVYPEQGFGICYVGKYQ